MLLSELKGKKITVMGLGLHGGGVGTARFLAEAGAQVIVTDLKSREELKTSLEKLKGVKNITYVFNQHRPEDFTKVDMVIKSPGAPWNNKYIKMALEKKIPVEIDSSLFFKLCKNQIIGITGTKGKTTTSSLIYEILKVAGKDVVKVGVGQTSVLDKLKKLKKSTIVVFELSSWRLSALGKYKLSPQIAVVTNIYPDHLNYYKSMKEYIEDKKFILANQKKKDTAIINWDDEKLREWEIDIHSQLIKFSKEKVEDGKRVYVQDGVIYYADGENEKKVMDVKDLKIRGEHNIPNVLAAIGAGVAADINLSYIKKAVMQFSGVVHRLELVRDLKGVKYYNDTAATMPEAAISGINSFSEPLVLIAGGADKNLDMKELAKVIVDKVKSIIFLKGVATDKLIAEMKKSPDLELDFKIVDSMEKAVELAQKEAEAGDVVLLSPGAASFGLFNNEFDRGDKFREAVMKLK